MKNIDKVFDKFKKRLEKEHSIKIADFKKEIKPLDLEGLKHWRYLNLLTPATKNKNWASIKELKDYLIERCLKNQMKTLDADLSHLKTVMYSGDLKSISISIERKKSATWGSNPSAQCEMMYEKDLNPSYSEFYSGSITGCGYDKESTAVARVLNQCNPFLKLMYILKAKHINGNNREIFGYGSGSGLLPRIEGGVGVSCYPAIFAKLGFKFTQTASGKSFDAYKIEKI